MEITAASTADLDEAVACWVNAFASDPITGFLLQIGHDYRERLTQFFSILMRARIALGMPVFVARGVTGMGGATMGYSTLRSEWPASLTEEWDRFERGIPGMTDRMAVYDEVATRFRPLEPHYYLGVIGTDPTLQGAGIGTRLLKSFCDASARDPLSGGVYLETAQPSNVRFYERAGFAVSGLGQLGGSPLWCMYLSHERP